MTYEVDFFNYYYYYYFSLEDECHVEVLDRRLRPVPVRPPVSHHRGGRLSVQTGEPRRGRGARGARQILHGSQTLHQPDHPAKVSETRADRFSSRKKGK